MKFSFVADMQKELFDLTRGAWMSQLENNPEQVSATYYAAGLEYCDRHMDGRVAQGDGGGCVAAVQEEGKDYAAALIVISHAKAKGEVRMLEVYVQPDLNLADAPPNYAVLAWIAASAIVGCLELTYGAYPSQQLKLHTAFPLDKQFMTAITTVIFGQGQYSDYYDLSSQGNWILVSKKAGPDGAHVGMFGPVV